MSKRRDKPPIGKIDTTDLVPLGSPDTSPDDDPVLETPKPTGSDMGKVSETVPERKSFTTNAEQVFASQPAHCVLAAHDWSKLSWERNIIYGLPQYTFTRLLQPPGNQATVFKIRTDPGRDEVLKLFNPDAKPIEALKQVATLHELTKLPAIRRHLPVIHEFPKDDGKVCYVRMEWIEGQDTLSTLAERHKSAEAKVKRDLLRQYLQILSTCSRVIHEAHAKGIAHGDLKPDNVLLDGDVPKIIDWPALNGDLKVSQSASRTTATIAGLHLVTPEWAAPEQFEAKLKPASDIFCIGAMAHAFATGHDTYRPLPIREPEEGKREYDRRRIVAAKANLVVAIPQELYKKQRRLAAIIAIATKEESTERFASAEDLQKAFDGLLSHESPVHTLTDFGYREGTSEWARRSYLLRRNQIHVGVAIFLMVCCGILAVIQWSTAARARTDALNSHWKRFRAEHDKVYRDGPDLSAAEFDERFRLHVADVEREIRRYDNEAADCLLANLLSVKAANRIIHSEFVEAVEASTAAMEIAKRYLGSESPRFEWNQLYFMVWIQKATAVGYGGEVDEAIEQLDSVEKAVSEQLVHDDPLCDRIYMNVCAYRGLLFSMIGKDSEAIDEWEQALAIWERMDDPEEDDIEIAADVANCLANWLRDAGDAKRAAESRSLGHSLEKRMSGIERSVVGAYDAQTVAKTLLDQAMGLKKDDPSRANLLHRSMFWAKEAFTRSENVWKMVPQHRSAKGVRSVSSFNIAECHLFEEPPNYSDAVTAIEEALKTDDGRNHDRFSISLHYARICGGNLASVGELEAFITGRNVNDPNLLYNAACGLSRALRLVPVTCDIQLVEGASKETLRDQALAYLRASFKQSPPAEREFLIANLSMGNEQFDPDFLPLCESFAPDVEALLVEFRRDAR